MFYAWPMKRATISNICISNLEWTTLLNGGPDCSADFLQEFWFTAGATFFYFTAFVSLLAGFVGVEDEEWQYWIDANIAAGVSHTNTGERETLGILAGDEIVQTFQ